MRRAALTFLCLGLLAAPAPARSQSLYGPGGLLLYPTADVPPQGQATPAFLVLPQRIPSTPGLHELPTWGSFSLDYGLTDNIEIGVTALLITDFEPSYGGFFKYRFLREEHGRPALAAGFTFTGFGDNDTRAGFLAARKQVSGGDRHPIIAHVGIQYIDKLAGLPYEQVLPYGGVELGLTRRLRLIGEVRPRGESDFKVSTAVSLAYRSGRGNRIAVTWANTGQSTQPRFGIGAGFSIGTRR